jgi:prepilin-type N-terminal cleavage/methylation domain-containing protein
MKAVAMNPCRKSTLAWPPSVSAWHAARRGFTLVELLVVMAIIGIILSLVLVAGMEAANRANERATQSLITKIEAGLNDRLEALLQNEPMPNYTHGYLAGMYSSLAAGTGNPNGMLPPVGVAVGANLVDNPGVKETARAQAIAWYDYIKAEMPDVFYIQNFAPTAHQYPLNFAGVAFLGSFNLPLGNSVAGPLILNGGFGDYNGTFTATQSIGPVSNPTLGLAGSGIYGASYAAAAGVYKGLGYLPLGYDGIDNDNDSLIDNYNEGLIDPRTGTVDPLIAAPDNPSVTMHVSALIATRLANHTHVTARAEVLYALLVEGSGPLGSVFQRDDFSDKEVQDTDKDGMPEFVDAWGQPLQFFRWPLLYHSDLQRGQNVGPVNTRATGTSVAGESYLNPPYVSMFDQREQDTLDPNQQLVAPGWWSTVGTGGLAANNNTPGALSIAVAPPIPSGVSTSVQTFQALFHRLTEPMSSATGSTGFYWDRGGYSFRRAFYSKFLILSAGQDTLPGVFLYADTDMQTLQTAAAGAAPYLIANENNALPFSVGTRAGLDVGDLYANPTITNLTCPSTPSQDPTHPSSYDLQQSAQDDITNHNLQSGGAIGGSG